MTTQSHLYNQDDEMKLPSCCAHHGFEEGGCNGRNCPEGRVDLRAILTRRVSEADMLRQCARSGQVDSRQIAAHLAAGEFPIGYESADPAHREPVRVAREPLPIQLLGKEPPDWSQPEDAGRMLKWIALGLVLIVAVPAISAWLVAAALDSWPQLVARFTPF